MATTREIMQQKRVKEAWDQRMAQIRAAEAAKAAWPGPFVPPEEPQPKKDEPSNG